MHRQPEHIHKLIDFFVLLVALASADDDAQKFLSSRIATSLNQIVWENTARKNYRNKSITERNTSKSSYSCCASFLESIEPDQFPTHQRIFTFHVVSIRLRVYSTYDERWKSRKFTCLNQFPRKSANERDKIDFLCHITWPHTLLTRRANMDTGEREKRAISIETSLEYWTFNVIASHCIRYLHTNEMLLLSTSCCLVGICETVAFRQVFRRNMEARRDFIATIHSLHSYLNICGKLLFFSVSFFDAVNLISNKLRSPLHSIEKFF